MTSARNVSEEDRNKLSTRRGVVAAVVLIWLVGQACSGSDASPTPTGTPISVATATATQAPKTATVPAFDDPRELASFLVARAKAGDWASLRPFLGDEFLGF